ncbi:MAG: cell division protein ZapD [Gammaproteobacteria bacterium]|nr:cell division protein ZapD [Gammaproteobacteria bacterium]
MSVIIYEQPLNERVRTLLRLDFLFKQASHSLEDHSAWGSRATINALLDILNVFVRSDLKTELIKELERLATLLSPLEHRPGVDQQALGPILRNLERLSDLMQSQQGQIGNGLKDHEFLNAIRQRSAIPGGTCQFDLPAYHHWLSQSVEQRTRDLESWLASFAPLKDASALILHLIRESASSSEETAEQGFFQQPLDTQVPYQLIRVILPQPTDCFAEISGGKHRFTIRFMRLDANGHPTQTDENIGFKLLRCAI